MDTLTARTKTERLGRIAAASVLLLCLLFMLALLPMSLLRTRTMAPGGYYGDVIQTNHDNLYLNLIVLSVICGALYILYKFFDMLRLRRLEMLSAALTLAFGAWFIGSAKLYPIYQMPGIIASSALNAARGNYAAAFSSIIYDYYPQKLACVLLYEGLVRAVSTVLGHMPDGYYALFLQAAQLCFLTGGVFALTEYVELVYGGDAAKLASVMLMFNMPAVLWCTVIDSLIPALALLCLALWLAELGRQRKRPLFSLLAALALALCVVLHPTLAFAAAFVILGWLLSALRERSPGRALYPALTLLFALLLSLLPERCYTAAAGREFADGLPLGCYADMALSYSYSGIGRYAPDDSEALLQSCDYDYAATSEAALSSASEKLRALAEDPHEFVSFFLNKLYDQFNEPECQSLWINRAYGSYTQKGLLYTLVCEKGEGLFAGAMACWQMALYLGFTLGLAMRLWRRRFADALTPAVTLSGLLLSLAAPAEPRFALPYILMMFPLSAGGLCELFAMVDRR